MNAGTLYWKAETYILTNECCGRALTGVAVDAWPLKDVVVRYDPNLPANVVQVSVTNSSHCSVY